MKTFFLFLFISQASYSFHILVDPGHGGRDGGAQVDQVRESEVIWPWALALKRELIRQGFEVSLSRQESKAPLSLIRKKIFSDPQFDLIISLHANYFLDPKVKGLEYFLRNPLSWEDQKLKLAFEEKNKSHVTVIVEDLKKQALLRQSLQITKKLQRAWPGKIQQGSFDVLELSPSPAVLIELGYLSNPMDLNQLQNPEFIEKQARALAKSLASSFDVDLGVN